MARFANIGTADVCSTLAGSNYTVMALTAAIGDPRVTEQCWSPTESTVTRMTLLSGGDMIRVLTARVDAVVATRTHSDDMDVIHTRNGFPYRCAVASFTNIRCRDMTEAFSSRCVSIVTANTVAGYA